MNLALKIARKYFLSKNEKHFINIISIISMVTLAFGTAALFIILSVFNGLHVLISGVHTTFDAELTIMPSQGKTFVVDDEFLAKINKIENIKCVSEILEDDAFLNYEGIQKVVHIKGVSENFREQNKLDSVVKYGSSDLSYSSISKSIVGRGIQYELGFALQDEFKALDIWYPKRTRKHLGASENSLNKIKIQPTGIFELERQYDSKYIFIPLKFAQKLFEYTNERTSLEIKTSNGSIENIKSELKATLGKNFKVLDSDEMHSSLYKAIKIERFITYLIFVFILILASLNIFLALTMIVISKKKDIAILFSMGATKQFITKIFLYEGLLIGVFGTSVGLLLGIGTVFIQEQFGLVGMDVQSAIVDAFPVKMKLMDVFYTGITTLSITILLSIQPAFKASSFDVEKL